MFATVIGIRLSPNAINGETKKVIIVIAVVGRPIPITPLTMPATKKAKLTISATSFELVDISNY
jgi:hypothetical protein